MCVGECKVQVYDFDFTGFTVQVDPAKGCPVLTPDELSAGILATIVAGFSEAPVGGPCEGAGCECIPSSHDPDWSMWVDYDFPETVLPHPAGTKVKDGSKACTYKVSGTYWVCSAVLSGVCMKKPKTPWVRPKNPQRPDKKKKPAK
jgi:hypothetical protein